MNTLRLPNDPQDIVDAFNAYGLGKGLILTTTNFLLTAIHRIIGEEHNITMASHETQIRQIISVTIDNKTRLTYELSKSRLNENEFVVSSLSAAA